MLLEHRRVDAEGVCVDEFNESAGLRRLPFGHEAVPVHSAQVAIPVRRRQWGRCP